MGETKILINGDNEKYEFDPFEWLRQFKIASENRSGFQELRAAIFQDTVKIVLAGGYSFDDKAITFDMNKTRKETEFYKNVLKIDDCPAGNPTQFSVIEADCLEVTELLTKADYNPCVLNMASRKNPGGGVLGGAGAQEENMFRRSDMFASLYQYAPYANQYWIPKATESYPLNRNTGGCYSGAVTVFRGSEKNGYCLLKTPYHICVVTVPAINRPELVQKDRRYEIAEEFIAPTKEKMRTILRIAGHHQHDCLILGAFGCGAFRTPPRHVAELFKDVFHEEEFLNKFRLVVFPILNDHNSGMSHNPQGNMFPFLEVFGDV